MQHEFAHEVVALEAVVVPEREAQRLAQQLVARQVEEDEWLVPLRVQRLHHRLRLLHVLAVPAVEESGVKHCCSVSTLCVCVCVHVCVSVCVSERRRARESERERARASEREREGERDPRQTGRQAVLPVPLGDVTNKRGLVSRASTESIRQAGCTYMRPGRSWTRANGSEYPFLSLACSPRAESTTTLSVPS